MWLGFIIQMKLWEKSKIGGNILFAYLLEKLVHKCKNLQENEN